MKALDTLATRRQHRYSQREMKGRGPVAANEVSGVASATPIRAGRAESADMSLSDRQRPEGFHPTTSSAVLSTNPLSSTIYRALTTEAIMPGRTDP